MQVTLKNYLELLDSCALIGNTTKLICITVKKSWMLFRQHLNLSVKCNHITCLYNVLYLYDSPLHIYTVQIKCCFSFICICKYKKYSIILAIDIVYPY